MTTTTPSVARDDSQPSPKRPDTASLRVWPAVVLTLVFWIYLYANHALDMTSGERFISRMLGCLVAMLAFIIWWLSRSKVAWRDRLLALAVPIALGALTAQFTDKKTMGGFALFLTSLPIVMGVWTGWLLIARRLQPRTQRIGFIVAMALTFPYFTLIRSAGLAADQTAEIHWRWTPTKESLFLANHSKAPADSTKAVASAEKTWTIQPGDCPEFRGPQRDGVVAGVSIAADWDKNPPKLLWQKRVGPGWSAMIVVDGHLVTQEQRDAVEAVVCYDAATGNELWAHNDTDRFEEALAGAGPRGTPTFAGNRIYALGANGRVNCLIPETGEVVWSRSITKDAGVPPSDLPQWGYSNSPLMVDDLVVVFAGGSGEKNLLAYRVKDGEIAWTAKGGKQSYSSPQLAVLDGQKQILMHDTGALRGYNIADGAELWSFPNGSALALPMIQPHVFGPADIAASITPGMHRIAVKREGQKWSATSRWNSNTLKPDFSDFAVHEGAIYGLSDRIMCCLDAETGAKVWKKSRLGPGQLLLIADQDALLLSNEKGEIILVGINREGPIEIGRFKAIEGKTWNGPVLVGNRVFLRNAEEMAAYEINVQPTKPSAPGSALPTNEL